MPNEESVREMTICHPPQREEKDPRTCWMPSNPKPVARDFKGFYFTFYFIYFQFTTNHTHCFHKTLKSKFNSLVLISLKSFVRRKLIPVFDPRPLYCSSLTTAVGGI